MDEERRTTFTFTVGWLTQILNTSTSWGAGKCEAVKLYKLFKVWEFVNSLNSWRIEAWECKQNSFTIFSTSFLSTLNTFRLRKWRTHSSQDEEKRRTSWNNLFFILLKFNTLTCSFYHPTTRYARFLDYVWWIRKSTDREDRRGGIRQRKAECRVLEIRNLWPKTWSRLDLTFVILSTYCEYFV